LAVVSLNNARQKSRDAKRVSDIKQIQTALELYFADQNGYPVAATAINLGESTYTTLSSGGGFAATSTGTVYMGQVPYNQGPPASEHYTYTSADGSTYSLTFNLEGATGGLAAGDRTASPSGIQ
jgi:hypothetical protein